MKTDREQRISDAIEQMRDAVERIDLAAELLRKVDGGKQQWKEVYTLRGLAQRVKDRVEQIPTAPLAQPDLVAAQVRVLEAQGLDPAEDGNGAPIDATLDQVISTIKERKA